MDSLHSADSITNLLSALSSICTGQNADIEIKCGEKTFLCHSVILKARSSVFNRLLEMEPDKHGICVDGVKETIMAKLLEHIYKNVDVVTKEDLVDLIIGAVHFQLKFLLYMCYEYFVGAIQSDSTLALDVLLISSQLNLTTFKSIALQRMTKNRQVLMKDPDVREKLKRNPEVLLLLYQELNHETIQQPRFNQTFVSHHSYSSSSQDLKQVWNCLCGVSTFYYCSWCGRRAG